MEGKDAQERPEPSEIQRVVAEFAGTFFLTFVAAGADVLESLTGGGIGHVARYVAPAFSVMAMIYTISAISGAHINPAVTLAFFARRCFPARRLPGYLIAQLLGAVAAAGLLYVLFGTAVEHGITKPIPGFDATQAFGMEVLLATFLVYTILATSQEKAVVGKNSGFAVAGVIALCGLAFSPVSGASMNPARSLGPMIVAMQLQYWYVYVFAPLIGAAIAVALTWFLHGPPNQGEQEGARGKTEASA